MWTPSKKPMTTKIAYGTLFGHNTIGGAIQLISKTPDEEFGGYVQDTTGSYDRIDVQAALNVPISDTLRTKFSGITRNRDGYVTNAIGQDLGDDNRHGRDEFP
jgi:iron complex outermembrane receptor protein